MGDTEPVCELSMFVYATYICVLHGGFCLSLLIKRFACKLQAELKAHLCQVWVNKHLPLSLLGRWKYLVHGMGLLNTVKWYTALSSWDLKGRLLLKRQKSKKIQAKHVLLYSKKVQGRKKKGQWGLGDDWKSKSKYSLLYSLFQATVQSEKNWLLQMCSLCSL